MHFPYVSWLFASERKKQSVSQKAFLHGIEKNTQSVSYSIIVSEMFR